MSTIMVVPEIDKGSLVIFEDPNDPKFSHNPADREWQEGAIRTYGPGPFQVFTRIDEHVVINDNEGKAICFGSSGNARLHIKHVKLWRPDWPKLT